MSVFIIAATSVDGYIGIDDQHLATSWTTTADKKFFVRKTKEAGVVIMGRKTFETFGKPLKDRRLIVYTRQPDAVRIDGVEATNEAPAVLIARLTKEGAKDIVICGGASIYALFMKAGLVDELYVTIMPKVFGQGISLFGSIIDRDLQLLEVEELDDNNTVLLRYQVL